MKNYFNNLYDSLTESLEDSSELIDIDIYDEGTDEFVGSANGVLHKNKERLFNLLEMEKASNEAFEYFNNLNEEQYIPIAILQNVNIFEERRSEGYGRIALDDFIVKSYDKGAKSILLIADVGEENKFNLVKWYERNGFIQIGMSGLKNPIMVMEQ